MATRAKQLSRCEKLATQSKHLRAMREEKVKPGLKTLHDDSFGAEHIRSNSCAAFVATSLQKHEGIQ